MSWGRCRGEAKQRGYLERVLVGDLPEQLQIEGRSHGFD